MRNDFDVSLPAAFLSEQPGSGEPANLPLPVDGLVEMQQPDVLANVRYKHGWPIPSTIFPHPNEARACIYLPEFEASVLEQARVISDNFPFAEAEYRSLRGKEHYAAAIDIPHFEKVFRIAAGKAGIPGIEGNPDYDELLILTAWHCVRPGSDGFLASYPKSLLCPLSHASPPVALGSLSTAKRIVFDRRAPVYLRYMLSERFGLRTCSDIENADLRQLLRSAGFRLIRASAVPEVAFTGITQGEDPPVRPWKLTLRQELSDDRAAEMFINAALWQIKFGLRLVSLEEEQPRWNIGAFTRTDWEDTFLSLGVRVSPSLMRESGLLDWRMVLARCIQQIRTGNLPADVLAKVTSQPQRVPHVVVDTQEV